MQPGLELDIQLARAIGEGSREAMERMLDRHLGPLYRYVLRRLGQGKERQAEAITAAAFDDAMRRMKRYSQGERTVPMRLWLLRLANRHIVRYDRKVRSAGELSPLYNDLDRLREAIAGLRPKDADAAALALLEEMMPGEIAEVLGVSRNAAMKHLRHAMQQLGARHFQQPHDWSLDG